MWLRTLALWGLDRPPACTRTHSIAPARIAPCCAIAPRTLARMGQVRRQRRPRSALPTVPAACYLGVYAQWPLVLRRGLCPLAGIVLESTFTDQINPGNRHAPLRRPNGTAPRTGERAHALCGRTMHRASDRSCAVAHSPRTRAACAVAQGSLVALCSARARKLEQLCVSGGLLAAQHHRRVQECGWRREHNVRRQRGALPVWLLLAHRHRRRLLQHRPDRRGQHR